MTLLVKICGLSTRETLDAALAAGADMVGFVFFPPSPRRFMMQFHNVLERAGRRFWPIFSGVIVVEAQMRLYQGVPVAQRASRRVFVPVFSPQGATRLGRRAADAGPAK